MTFVDVRTSKIKSEEQFKYEVGVVLLRGWLKAAVVLQVNEISWCKGGDQFFITNGNGCVIILR